MIFNEAKSALYDRDEDIMMIFEREGNGMGEIRVYVGEERCMTEWRR